MALVYENYVPKSYRDAFVKRVREISAELKINPNWLMAIMYWESAGTFSPSIKNSIGASGLIQFLESTAEELGTTTSYLRSLSAVQQLDWVLKYYKMWYRRLGIDHANSYTSSYFIVFYPKAVNKPDNYILGTTPESRAKIAAQNPAFDLPIKDGKVYVWEVKKVMLSKLPSEWLNEFSLSLLTKSYKKELIYGIITIGIGLTAVLYGLKLGRSANR